MGEQHKTTVWKKILAAALAIVFIALAFGAGWLARTYTLDKRLSSYAWALGIIDEYYYYDIDTDDATDGALSGLASMLDDYSAYYTAEEYAALLRENSGERSGIGITYSFVEGKGALVVSVIGNSPAYMCGLRAGDYITGGSVGGAETVFADSADFSQFISERAAGESFSFELLGGNSVTLSKQTYISSYTSMSTRDTGWVFRTSGNNSGLALFEEPSEAMDFLPENTAYVSISQFYGSAAGELGALLGKFNESGCTSLILDLRNNGGGYVSVMQDMAGYFTSSVSSSAVAMTAKYKNGKNEVYYCINHSENLVPEGTKIYVMANSGTASASEALIGVLVSYGLLDYENIFLSDFSEEYLEWAGTAKTRCTYGKGIMQTTFVNGTGEALKLTTAQIYWQNGKCIHGVGLTVDDGCIPVEAEWIVTCGDSELKRVAEIVGARAAS